MKTKKYISASFEFVEDLIRSIQHFQKEGRNFTTFSPVPNHDLESALKQKKSKVGLFTLAGAIIGLVSGFSLAIFTAADWNLILGGKPAITIFPFIVIGFEFTILFGAIATLVGLIINIKLPNYKKFNGYKNDFSVDKFGIVLEVDNEEVQNLKDKLISFGSKEVTYE
jgi:hypothetical protein